MGNWVIPAGQAAMWSTTFRCWEKWDAHQISNRIIDGNVKQRWQEPPAIWDRVREFQIIRCLTLKEFADNNLVRVSLYFCAFNCFFPFVSKNKDFTTKTSERCLTLTACTHILIHNCSKWILSHPKLRSSRPPVSAEAPPPHARDPPSSSRGRLVSSRASLQRRESRGMLWILFFFGVLLKTK